MSREFPHRPVPRTSSGNTALATVDIATIMALSTNKALIVAGSETERMMSEAMGNEIVTVYVGLEQKVFTVHKQLITATADFFTKYFNTKLKANQGYILHDVHPATFQFFVEYLYTRRVPGVIVGSSGSAQAERIRQLCQLSAFAEKFKLHAEPRNRIMDAIQDGFLIFCRTPEPGLIRHIYNNTLPESKLRKFCAATMVYSLQSPSYVEDGALAALITEKDDIIDDFLGAVRGLGEVGRDPRVRDCGGDAHCVECILNPTRLEGKHGFWPCHFHIHEESTGIKVEAGSERNLASGASDVVFGKDCYLCKSS